MIATPPFGEVPVMSETLAVQTKPTPTPTRNGASDLRVLVRVEKWMAMIREISREQQDEIKFHA